MKFRRHIFYFIEILRRGAVTKLKRFALAALLVAPLPRSRQ